MYSLIIFEFFSLISILHGMELLSADLSDLFRLLAGELSVEKISNNFVFFSCFIVIGLFSSKNLHLKFLRPTIDDIFNFSLFSLSRRYKLFV